MADDTFWQTKLHARLHDPAEKALVLLRDPSGHEGGTSRALHRDLGFDTLPVKDWLDPDNADVLDRVLFENGVPITIYRDVKRADWWAAGADRPQWPMQEITTATGKTQKVADWAQVRWSKEPVLIHPLTGQYFHLDSLADTDVADIKRRSFAHFTRLIVRNREDVDWARTLLAYWRFGPELSEDEDNGKLGLLWPLLPADTRVPDHSIWDHLDLTSAFAGAFAADPDGQAALLVVSLGPVQSFIAAARSTSDLWAGSHLLSRLAWEAMKPVCERLGPDAILFPRLRGVPQVDLWLRDEMGLRAEWFEKAIWQNRATDANPLFAAALPNRFVAVVPASKVEAIAEEITKRVRKWLQGLGERVVARLLQTAGYASGPESYAHKQMRRQLEGFPEVHWAAVPFSLIRARNAEKQTDLDVGALIDAMAPFFDAKPRERCGFLASPAWQVLGQEVACPDNTTFFAPKPGVLYPTIYELAERALAAAKSTHAFDQLEQEGWRDSLTGESEWLTVKKDELAIPPGQRADTLWMRVAKQQPAWARVGEHLGALSAVKRLWPTLFAQEVAMRRFVVSTHTMALAKQIDDWLESESRGSISQELQKELHRVVPAALPRRLIIKHVGKPELDWAKAIPALLDEIRDDPDESRGRRIETLVKNVLGDPAGGEKGRLESYYALLMMDGDEMGAWLSGAKQSATYCESFHPSIRAGFDKLATNELLAHYGKQPRAVSPNRHLAISAALNDFALHAVPHVIEIEHAGRVLYAGGDDVLAMLPVADLVPAMQRLRWAYSGHGPCSDAIDWREARKSGKLIFANGFGLIGDRFLRLMGERATASCGAVVAHHQAPLAAVLRELRAAERRAKDEGGKNSWSVSLIKRSGGSVTLTAKWGEPLTVFEDLRVFLADPNVSRRAVYNALEWTEHLPPEDHTLLGALLGYQLERQASSAHARSLACKLAPRLVKIAFDPAHRPKEANPMEWLRSFLMATEFLAREVRA